MYSFTEANWQLVLNYIARYHVFLKRIYVKPRSLGYNSCSFDLK